MKSSNKLLILFGLVLLLSPLIFISIYVKAHYEMRATAADEGGYRVALNIQSPGMTRIVTPAFSHIVVNGEKSNINMTYYLTRSSDYGVKIPYALKDITKVDVNADGTLEITVDHNFEEDPYSGIIIYAPANVGLTMNNCRRTTLDAYADTLHYSDSLSLVALNSSAGIRIYPAGCLDLLANNSALSLDGIAKINRLKVNASGRSSIVVSDSLGIDRMELELKDNSRFDGNRIKAKEIWGTIAENAILEGIDRSVVKKL